MARAHTIAKIQKLRKSGLSDSEIAEHFAVSLEYVRLHTKNKWKFHKIVRERSSHPDPIRDQEIINYWLTWHSTTKCPTKYASGSEIFKFAFGKV